MDEIAQDRRWYGNYTLQENGEFNVKGSFQTDQEEEWTTMSASIAFSSELSAEQIHFLNYGVIVVVIMVLGYSMFYLKKRLKKLLNIIFYSTNNKIKLINNQ